MKSVPPRGSRSVRCSFTLKALATYSPGRGPRAASPHGVEVFALKPWVNVAGHRSFATLKGLRSVVNRRTATQPLQGCEESLVAFIPRVAKAQPCAGISERFQRNSNLRMMCRESRTLSAAPRALLFCVDRPGVSLHSTPGFMPTSVPAD